jgi:predicted RNA-binding protein (virulence factor B family)
MRGLYELLDRDSAYRMGDAVRGRIYEFSDNFGCFVAVDDHICARIPKHENTEGLRIGQVIDATVTGVKPDGKLDLSIREKSYLQMDRDGEKIMARLEAAGGTLMLCDRSAPELIRSELQMSKNEFKRAIGRLYKAGRIRIEEDRIVKGEK